MEVLANEALSLRLTPAFRKARRNTVKPFAGFLVNGTPGEIRTPDRLVRSQVLYPAELRALLADHFDSYGQKSQLFVATAAA